MEHYFRILGIVLAGVLSALFLRHGGFRLALSLCCLALCGAAAVSLLKPVLQAVVRLTELAGVSLAVFGPVFKASAIGILTQTAKNYCRDAGEQALAGTIEFGGVLAILYVSLPLVSSVMDLLERMIGG